MKKLILVIIGLMAIHAEKICLSGGGCSTLCTQETTVTTLHTTVRDHGTLSVQRRYHPANKSQSMKIDALKIAKKTKAHDIYSSTLTQAEKEERARLIREGATLRIKEIQDQEQEKAQERAKRRRKGRRLSQVVDIDVSVKSEGVPAGKPCEPIVPVEEA